MRAIFETSIAICEVSSPSSNQSTGSSVREPPRSLTAEEEALVIDAWASYLDTALALDRIRRFHEDFYRFDLSRLERNSHVRSFLLSFAAELSLYENTTRLIEVLDGNENVVRFLNAARRIEGSKWTALPRSVKSFPVSPISAARSRAGDI